MSSDRFRSARWAVVEELGDGRWRLTIRDEADDELGDQRAPVLPLALTT